MTRVSETALEDAYGPTWDVAELWVGGFVLFGALPVTVVGFADGIEPLAVPVAALISLAVITRMTRVVLRRRFLRRVLLEGRSVEAVVTDKLQEIFNGIGGAVQPLFWLTVDYSIAGVHHASKRRVTDRVYLAARAGRPLRVRLLAEHPEFWVPDLAGPQPPPQPAP